MTPTLICSATVTYFSSPSGHGLELQHFRKTEQCGGIEELPPVEKNLRYDFNYQQINHLQREVIVKPVSFP